MILQKGLAALTRYVAIKRDPVQYARSIGVAVGDNCRLLGVTAGTFGSEPYLIQIGNHVTITAEVQFITHDGGVWVFRESLPALDVIDPIKIGSNVFLGLRSIIMPGVTIGDNCVIGAGSVVTKDIPSNSVAAGVPARVLMTLDEYRVKSIGRGLHIRSLPSRQKKQFLIERFGNKAR